MHAISNEPNGALSGVDQEFFDLVYADEALLRSEFDAIVAEAWTACPPPVGRRATLGAVPRYPRRPPVLPVGAAVRYRPARPGVGARHRQRSPPDRDRQARGAPRKT